MEGQVAVLQARRRAAAPGSGVPRRGAKLCALTAHFCWASLSEFLCQ